MKILIICTYYPPDTAISAVRPYMFAKYFTKMGHSVTVIRSGLISNKIDENFVDESGGVRVYSYMGENSPAERFARGEIKDFSNIKAKKKLDFLPNIIRKTIFKIYHGIMHPIKVKRSLHVTEERKERLISFIDNMQEKEFDVVFATYSDLENTYAGAYAARKFGCKYILDFRDLIAQRAIHSPYEFLLRSRIQKEVVSFADACTTVSEGLSEEIRLQSPEKRVFTVYNGYEKNDEESVSVVPEENKLVFCYTGTLYGNLRDASPIFKVLKCLSDDNKIDINNIKFHYAGAEFETLQTQAATYGMTGILENHGYINKDEANCLQCLSDFFVVISWNTSSAKGIMTGKFYEALKNNKPIIAIISGNEPQSELRQIITKYNLGVCYEQAEINATEQAMYNYILEQYNRKMNSGQVSHEPVAEVFEKFEYSKIAKTLESIMEEIVEK